jgi:hypothetical protein
MYYYKTEIKTFLQPIAKYVRVAILNNKLHYVLKKVIANRFTTKF